MGECFRRRGAERKPDPPAEAPLSTSNRLAGIDKAKLANGCGAEPQDNLVVLGVMGEGSVTLVEFRCAFPSPEARPQPAQPAQCQATRNWSSVEGIAPRQDVPLPSEPRAWRKEPPVDSPSTMWSVLIATRKEYSVYAVSEKALVSTTRPDKKKTCVDKTSSSWMCSAM